MKCTNSTSYACVIFVQENLIPNQLILYTQVCLKEHAAFMKT